MRASVLHMHACTAHTQTHPHPHTRTHARTRTYACMHRAHANAPAPAHTHARTHAHAHAHTRARVRTEEALLLHGLHEVLRLLARQVADAQKSKENQFRLRQRTAAVCSAAGACRRPAARAVLRGTDRRLPAAQTRGLPRLSALCRSSRPHRAPAWCAPAPFHPRAPPPPPRPRGPHSPGGTVAATCGAKTCGGGGGGLACMLAASITAACLRTSCRPSPVSEIVWPYTSDENAEQLPSQPAAAGRSGGPCRPTSR